MEKYYDLIVSLIKENRKYPGCEDILEDIVSDVYAHAEVVLNTVTNESVVSSYLSKIVKTSMITVPRRLGIQTEHHGNINSGSNLVQNILQQAEEASNAQLLENEQEKDSAESSLILEDGENETLDEFSESAELEPEDEIAESLEQDADNSLELFIDDEEADESAEPSSLVEEESHEELSEDSETIDGLSEEDFEQAPAVHEVDKTLVDKMINGVPAKDEIEEDVADELLDVDTEPEDLEAADEVISLDEEIESDEEGVLFEGNEDAADSLIEEAPDEIDAGNIENSSNKNESPISYECFDFEPVKNNPYFDEIAEEIQKLQDKYSEKPIIEIFKLKYRKGMSIDEIASKLDIPDNDVFDALNELVYIVKE